MAANDTPEINLTLDPFGAQSAAAASAAAEAPAVNTTTAEDVVKLAEAQLTDAEKKAVSEFSEKIDITDTATVLQYGAGTQQKIANFSDAALQNVRTKDFGEVGDMVANLVGELKSFNTDAEDKGFFSFFRKTQKNINVMKAKYDKAEVSVNNIVSVLENHQVTLLKDVATLDKMYETNLTYFKELSMYILAGKQKLEKERSTTLVELKKKAEASGLPEDAQKANDFAAMCDRFEKKIYDLELTRMVSIQMAPQIRLVQNNDTLMSEKIQSTIVNTIPLWKSQMVIALGLAHSQQALEAQRAVTDMTNEMLKKNAEKLHQTTVNVAREAERGIIDIETLTHTNQELINTLDEVQQIQTEGREKRRAAEAELGRIENELKTKLLNIKQ
ncbi:MAG: toxic anion resistance protein [Eubacteriales bacterium]